MVQSVRKRRWRPIIPKVRSCPLESRDRELEPKLQPSKALVRLLARQAARDWVEAGTRLRRFLHNQGPSR